MSKLKLYNNNGQLLERRGWDSFGAGFYLAPRGSKKHLGIDFYIQLGEVLVSPVNGLITKLGWPYIGNKFFRLIQISNKSQNGIVTLHRAFYILPREDLKVGSKVVIGDILGTSQDLSTRYPGMMNHVHYEVMEVSSDSTTKHIDPDTFLW